MYIFAAKSIPPRRDAAVYRNDLEEGYRFASPVTVRSTAVAAAAAARPSATERVESWRTGRTPGGRWPWAALGILAVGMVASGAAAGERQGLRGRRWWDADAGDLETTASKPDISADGRFLVFADERAPASKYAIYRVDFPEGSPYPITPLSPEPLEDPAISSDWRLVATRASSGDGMLYMVAAADEGAGGDPGHIARAAAVATGAAGDRILGCGQERVADFGMVKLQARSHRRAGRRGCLTVRRGGRRCRSQGGEGLLALGTMRWAVAERRVRCVGESVRNSISVRDDWNGAVRSAEEARAVCDDPGPVAGDGDRVA